MKNKKRRVTRSNAWYRNNIFSKPSRSQEEMVGFILIILLVVVIGVVFMGYSLRHKQEPLQNVEVSSLINTMLEYTTNCTFYGIEYMDLRDLFKSCYNQERCSNTEQDSCTYLEQLTKDMLDKSVDTENKPISAYEFRANFIGEAKNSTILSLTKGVCNKNITLASQQIAAEQGNILISLKFCQT